jgi:hypothetical protein
MHEFWKQLTNPLGCPCFPSRRHSIAFSNTLLWPREWFSSRLEGNRALSYDMNQSFGLGSAFKDTFLVSFLLSAMLCELLIWV